MNFKLLAFASILLGTTIAGGYNIDLSTIPRRDTVQLTIYNAEDLTLVRETRLITFKTGNNPLQFSWADTLIDPTSVQLQFRDQPDKLTVLDTTFPHEKPHELTWNVRSDFSGEARVEISYFTSGITWSADYTGIVDTDKIKMGLEGFVTVTNRSGEDYEQAQVRLVVGKVNLVEKIAELAQRGIRPGQGGMDRKQLRREAVRQVVAEAETALAFAIETPKQIVKEGLSEYFIFTIEGTETVPSGWSKRMRSFQSDDVPFAVRYRYRPREYGDQLVKLFVLINNHESHLGKSPLPDGRVQLFKQTGSDGLSYLTQQEIAYIPIGDRIELNLGPNPEVVFELLPLRVFRDNLWGTWGAKFRRRFDQPGVEIQDRGKVTGWDEHTVFSQRIRNYTAKPIKVEIRRSFSGDAMFRSQLNPVLHDFQTVQLVTQVKAGQKADLRYELIMKQGDRAKQNRVQLDHSKPASVAWLQ